MDATALDSPQPHRYRLLRFATLCGALPLITGVGTFLLWLITRWQLFQFVGAVVLTVGPILFAIGMLALAWHLFLERKTLRRVWLATAACALLLLSNFPAAAAILISVARIESRYVVAVHNDSDQPLTNARLDGPSVDEKLPTLAPGKSITTSVWFQGDGALTLDGTLGNQPIHAIVEGYVTGGMGGNAEVTVSSAHAIEVTHPVHIDY